MNKFCLSTLVATAGLSLATVVSAPAYAGGFVQGTCALNNVTAEGVAATACANFTGNNDNYKIGSGPVGFENYIASAFSSNLSGLTGGTWSKTAKSDQAGDILNDLVSGSLQSGNWSLTQSINSPFVMTVKAGNFFAAYLFNNGSLTNVDSGTFNVAGATTKDGGGAPAALSHISLYTYSGSSVNTPPTTPAAAVPEPTTMAGLALAGGGLSFLKRRKQKQVG